MDKNEDSKLSIVEIKGPLKNDFSKVDSDEDGFIAEEEFKKPQTQNVKNYQETKVKTF